MCLLFVCFVLWVCTWHVHKICVWVCKPVCEGVWSEKHGLFYVAFTLCFSVSIVGGWLNESFWMEAEVSERVVWLGGEEGWETREKENQLARLLDS